MKNTIYHYQVTSHTKQRVHDAYFLDFEDALKAVIEDYSSSPNFCFKIIRITVGEHGLFESIEVVLNYDFLNDE